MRRTWWGGAAVLVAVGATAGCSGSDAKPSAAASFVAPVSASAAPAWSEPATYTYTLTRGCDDAKPLGKYQVAVENGAVVSSRRIDRSDASPTASSDVDLGPVTGDDSEEIDIPTLKGLLDLVQTASDDGGAVTQSFDATDGHPVKVSFNTSDSGAADQAECFGVSDYTVS